MGGFFDAYFGAHAAPELMNHMATPDAVTILDGSGTELVVRADAIIRHASIEDRFTDTEEIKVFKRQIDLLLDSSLSFKGLPNVITNGVAIVYEDGTAQATGVRWAIDSIANKTQTFQRIEVIRKTGRQKSITGRYFDQ